MLGQVAHRPVQVLPLLCACASVPAWWTHQCLLAACSTGQDVNIIVNESINESIDQSINQSINQCVTDMTKRLMAQEGLSCHSRLQAIQHFRHSAN